MTPLELAKDIEKLPSGECLWIPDVGGWSHIATTEEFMTLASAYIRLHEAAGGVMECWYKYLTVEYEDRMKRLEDELK